PEPAERLRRTNPKRPARRLLGHLGDRRDGRPMLHRADRGEGCPPDTLVGVAQRVDDGALCLGLRATREELHCAGPPLGLGGALEGATAGPWAWGSGRRGRNSTARVRTSISGWRSRATNPGTTAAAIACTVSPTCARSLSSSVSAPSVNGENLHSSPPWPSPA